MTVDLACPAPVPCALSTVPALRLSGGKAKKAKKTKDPNAPKRGTTAFFFFTNVSEGAGTGGRAVFGD